METTIATRIQIAEACIAQAVIGKYGFLDTQNPKLYRAAAAQVRRIVDTELRSYSNEEGVKAIDAYRYYHDNNFIPVSLAVVIDGEYMVQSDLASRLGEFIHPSDWGKRKGGWEHWSKLSGLTAFITHYAYYDDRLTVSQFFHLKCQNQITDELYCEVLEVLAEEMKKAAKT